MQFKPNRWQLAIFCSALLLLWGIIIEPRWVASREITATLTHAPNLRIAIASDWHFTKRPLWRVMTVDRARNIVQQINAAKPDIILLPGDFIADRDYKPTTAASAEDEIASVLGELKAPLGVYATLGNHDWWHNGSNFRAALENHGIHVLENHAIRISSKNLWLVGIGDDYTGHSNPELALTELPKDAPAIVIMHDPASFATIPKLKNGVFFAGHTHGGQVYLPWIGALIVPGAAPKKWAYGWVSHHENLMYVTSGLGVSILPVRFNMRPEWVLCHLTSK